MCSSRSGVTRFQDTHTHRYERVHKKRSRIVPDRDSTTIVGRSLEQSIEWLPPNGLPFSCRERAASQLQKSEDLAREAVGCNGVFGAPVALTRAASRMCQPHPPGIT